MSKTLKSVLAEYVEKVDIENDITEKIIDKIQNGEIYFCDFTIVKEKAVIRIFYNKKINHGYVVISYITADKRNITDTVNMFLKNKTLHVKEIESFEVEEVEENENQLGGGRDDKGKEA